MEIVSYPLQWPVGKPRTVRREVARFMTRLPVAYEGILAELDRFGARHPVISSNVRFGPRGGARLDPGVDPGVAVYFTLGGENKCLAIDRWTTVEDNMQAVNKSIQAIRGLNRWGSDQGAVDAAFAGFAALPSGTIALDGPGTGPHGKDAPWWYVLEVDPGADPGTIDAAYRRLAKVRHPDRGGTDALFAELGAAYDTALRAHR